MSGTASSSRLDKRAAVELRPLQLSLGQLDRADGSGRFGFGNSSALASVSGPLEVRLREEQPDKATFEILHRPLEGVGATPSRALIAALQAVLPPLLGLGQHPRSLVQLVVQSLSPAPFAYDPSMTTSFSTSSSNQKTWPKLAVEAEDDFVEVQKDTTGLAPMTGMFFSSRAACLNASTLALLDAGSISMRAVPIAVSIVYTRSSAENGGRLLLDPSNKEELNASSRHLFAWAFGAGISASGEVAATSDGMEVDGDDVKGEAELVWSENEGEFSRAQMDDAMDQSKAAARKILSFIRSELSEHFAKRLKRD